MKTATKEKPYLIPAYYQVLKEQTTLDPVDLSEHFNDVYKLLLRRLADFEMKTVVDYGSENELASILAELFRVKRKLEEFV